MRINSLYIKILLSLIALLIGAEFLILLVFKFSVMNHEPWKAVMKLHRANSFVIQELIRSRLRGRDLRDIEKNTELKNLLVTAGALYKARLWIEFPARGVVVKSFDGPVPGPPMMRMGMQERRPFFPPMHREPPKHFHFALSLDLGEPAFFHARIDDPPRFINEGVFLAGLAVIGLVIALLTIPVSRFISVPVKKLSRASRSIAEGNLSERVKIDRNDEIGDLGRAFNDMAQRVEDMIRSNRELTANISHELRSPLTRMSVAIELLLQEKPGNRLASSLTEEIAEMDRLIGRILQLSKLDLKDRGKQEETIDIPSLLKSLLKRYEATLSRKSIRVEVDLPDNGMTVRGAGDDIRMAVANIADNSIKYTPANGVITVTGEVSGDHIILVMENNCDPMSKEDAVRLFKPFFRPGDSREHGYGLGMAITKKIIELNGGSVAARQENGLFRIEMRFPVA